jgi:methylmalonyl-CoA/ethylmalonyl-CoA epimerase
MTDTVVQGAGLGSTTVTQIGIVVRDVERTARAYADVLGMPVPPVTITAPLEIAHTQYDGQPSPAQAKLCFFNLGQVSLELIEPIGAPSTWQDFLDKHGDGVHHIAFQIQGMDERLQYLQGQGISLIQRGDYTGGRYAYTDAEDSLAVNLELLENFRQA